MTAIDYKALGAKAAAEGKDMTKAQTGGGGDYTPPAAGPCGLRLVAYIELGKHVERFAGKPDTVKPKVAMVFELSGPNHPPHVSEDGTVTPIRVTVEENYSLNDKANFFKLFTKMNYAGTATHMIQLLGEAYLGTVVHRKYKKKSDPADPAQWTGVAVELKAKDTGYTIRPPRRAKIDEATGMELAEFIPINVAPAITPLKGFLWDYADMAQWACIFIDGQWPERKDAAGVVTSPARSKNVWQDQIKRAVNFQGSPIYSVLAAAGADLDIPDSVRPGDEEPDPVPATPAAGGNMPDPLAGVAV